MALQLTDLPPEVIHNVLIFVDPVDLGWIPLICKTLYYFVTKNSALFRDIYLAHLDTPPTGRTVDWEQGVRDLGRLQLICKRKSVESKKKELAFVHHAVIAILHNANGLSKEEGTGHDGLLPSDDPSSQEAVTLTPYLGSRSARLLSSLLGEPTNQAAFMCRSFIFERARAEIGSTASALLGSEPNNLAARGPGLPEEYQQSAKLHCLFGVAQLFANPVTAAAARGAAAHRRRSRRLAGNSLCGVEMSPYACSVVYDLRQYTEKSKWGPFMDDITGRVDWEKMEALMIVLGHNIRRMGFYKVPICRSWWDVPFGGCWSGSYVDPVAKYDTASSSWSSSSRTTEAATTSRLCSFQLQGSDEDKEEATCRQAQADLDARDPYGVTGTYVRIVCYLDYTDFFAFNFTQHQPDLWVPRPAIDYGQATRLIHMTCTVTAVDPPGPGEKGPVVRFVGQSKSLHSAWNEEGTSNDANSGLRGEVRLTPEGEVRWTTWSIFSGEERWRSESIQVGGPKSAGVIIGNWFDAYFDDHGPAGPTAFWKITNEVRTGLPSSIFGSFSLSSMAHAHSHSGVIIHPGSHDDDYYDESSEDDGGYDEIFAQELIDANLTVNFHSVGGSDEDGEDE